MEGELLLPLYGYRFIRLDFVTLKLVVVLDYTIIILVQQNEIDYYMNEDLKSIRHKEHTVEELIAAREAEEASVYTNE